MQIHELSTKSNKKKRIGRGGKRGTYSGRGMKGQKARSGGNVDPLFEGGRTTLVQKMKKKRGFKSPHAKKNVVTLAVLNAKFSDGDTVSLKTLVQNDIITGKKVKNGARIVATGEISKKLTVSTEIGVSTNAAVAIEKAGGTVEKEKIEKK
ncbi:MAG: 50S ribosomal protein L15 [Candidatus Moraniibacteriota bacterium]|nr:MAG: 50S ribosomal protein L15 [Candidatus Moranbacteria bacterium]